MCEIKLLSPTVELIRVAEIPATEKFPDVILWGRRAFMHSGDCSTYRECSAYSIS